MNREGDSVTACTLECFARSSAVFSPDNVWIIAAVNQESKRHRIMIHVNPRLDEVFKPKGSQSMDLADESRREEAMAAIKIYPCCTELIISTSGGACAAWKFGRQL